MTDRIQFREVNFVGVALLVSLLFMGYRTINPTANAPVDNGIHDIAIAAISSLLTRSGRGKDGDDVQGDKQTVLMSPPQPKDTEPTVSANGKIQDAPTQDDEIDLSAYAGNISIKAKDAKGDTP